MKKDISIVGLALVLVGTYFLFDNVLDLSFLSEYLNWEYIWPILLIIIGVRMISKKW